MVRNDSARVIAYYWFILDKPFIRLFLGCRFPVRSAWVEDTSWKGLDLTLIVCNWLYDVNGNNLDRRPKYELRRSFVAMPNFVDVVASAETP
jgi:hypothetical protein